MVTNVDWLLCGILFCQTTQYLIPRFIWKTAYAHKIATVFSWIELVIWLFHRGIGDFLSYHVFWFLVSLLAPCLLYVLSLWIVGTQMNADNLLPTDSFRLRGKLSSAFRRESLFNIYSSTYEELLYRWFLQNAIYELTRSAAVSIVVTSAVFFLVHVSYQIAIVQMADILLFSIAITLIYQWVRNPLYCIIIHILRNQLIICQKYVQLNKEQEKMARYARIMSKNRGNRSETM